ncbi:MAG: class I SAM-dependent methyltransferase family protein, partial [Candidatus Diapherotrites archaeon]|nr:class I SAM-dependent methyltransferase family protein [Candidatus Diapherotrites archaeon]
MLGIKVPLINAEDAKQLLSDQKVLIFDRKFIREKTYIVFPVSEKVSSKLISKLSGYGAVTVDMEFEDAPRRYTSIADYLAEKIPKKDLESINTAYDVIGRVAIIEIPWALEKHEALIGEAIIEVNKQVKTVCKKVGEHKGVFRIQELRVIAGEENTKTEYMENGCRMQMDVAEVYFSPRLSTERFRIAQQVQEKEVVGVLFAGIGPFAFVIAKVQPKIKKIYAVELNQEAYKWMVKNVALNKMAKKIEPIWGDVNEVVPARLEGLCDRVVMALPKGGEDFLEVSMKALKPEGGIIHFYSF